MKIKAGYLPYFLFVATEYYF